MFHSAFPSPNSMPSLEHEYGSRACGIQGHDSSKSLHMYMSPSPVEHDIATDKCYDDSQLVKDNVGKGKQTWLMQDFFLS